MLDYPVSKRLGSSFVLNVIDDDLAARETLGLHGVDNLGEHLLFATRVPNEFNFARFARRAQNADIELVGNDPGCLGNTSSLRKVFVIA